MDREANEKEKVSSHHFLSLRHYHRCVHNLSLCDISQFPCLHGMCLCICFQCVRQICDYLLSLLLCGCQHETSETHVYVL